MNKRNSLTDCKSARSWKESKHSSKIDLNVLTEISKSMKKLKIEVAPLRMVVNAKYSHLKARNQTTLKLTLLK